MASSLSDSAKNQLIVKAIARAEMESKSDAEFLRILRTAFFESDPDFRRQLPVHGGSRSVRTLRVGRTSRSVQPARRTHETRADPSFHIYEDPRFLANARALALKQAAKKKGPNKRIIGGNKVAGVAFSDCVALGDDNDWGCTGTLIAPRVVISAGHCAEIATRVFFGNDVTKKGTVIGVKKVVQHPKYWQTKHNDLLVLVLDKAATVKPRRIAQSADIDAATDGRAVGFGNVEATGQFGYGTKRQVDVPIASTLCQGKVGKKSDKMVYGCDTGLELVAGKPMLGKDSCNGDSGGPFYIADGDSWVLAGATSRATTSAMAACGDGGIYVRLDKYREWIEEAAGVKLR
jgi:secreted trypsin-like serine protease